MFELGLIPDALDHVVEQAHDDGKFGITVIDLVSHLRRRISRVTSSDDTTCLKNGVIGDGKCGAVR